MNIHSMIRTWVIVFLLTPTAISEAGVIVDYNMDTLSGSPTTVTAASSATGVTPLLMSVGDGLTPIYVAGPPNYFGANGWDTDQPNDYMEFGFSVQPGYVAAITQVSMTIQSALSGPEVLGMYLITDLSAAPVLLTTITFGAGTLKQEWSPVVSIPTVTSFARVRIREIGNKRVENGFPPGAGSIRLFNTSGTNIQVLGDVSFASVPEPAHSAVVLIGILAYLRRRQRSRSISTALLTNDGQSI